MAIVVLSSNLVLAKKHNGVITKDTVAADSTDGSKGITVGTLLLACRAITDKNDTMSLKLVPTCNDVANTAA
jgi:hypothetical protein